MVSPSDKINAMKMQPQGDDFFETPKRLDSVDEELLDGTEGGSILDETFARAIENDESDDFCDGDLKKPALTRQHESFATTAGDYVKAR